MGLEEFDSRLEIVILADPLAWGDLHCIGSYPTVKQRSRKEGLVRLTKLGFCGSEASLALLQGLHVARRCSIASREIEDIAGRVNLRTCR